jgi:hypothetical protein
VGDRRIDTVGDWVRANYHRWGSMPRDRQARIDACVDATGTTRHYASSRIRDLEGGSKPHMVAIGHLHKAMLMPTVRNLATYQVGCFQRQTPFMVRQSIAAHVGAWIIEVTPGRGADQLWNRTRAEFISFYRDEAGCDHEEATTC